MRWCKVYGHISEIWSLIVINEEGLLADQNAFYFYGFFRLTKIFQDTISS